VAAAAAAEARAEDRKTRAVQGDTDCVVCKARGFVTFRFANEDGEQRDGFSWCEICEHTGRVALCHSRDGYWAVRRSRLADFLGGEIDAHETDVVALGENPPPARYPASGS
jgi:hypothetical protein